MKFCLHFLGEKMKLDQEIYYQSAGRFFLFCAKVMDLHCLNVQSRFEYRGTCALRGIWIHNLDASKMFVKILVKLGGGV